MAVEYKRMQQRVGTYAQYETYKDKILPNEFIAVTSGYPSTPSGTALLFKNGTNEPRRLAMSDEIFEEGVSVKSETIATIWSGTQAQYNAIATPSDSTLYVISG